MDIINSDVIVLLIPSSLFLIMTILMHSGKGSGLSDIFGARAPYPGARRSSALSTGSHRLLESPHVGVAELGRRARLRA
jgi:preprotein translocase subunit SecG